MLRHAFCAKVRVCLDPCHLAREEKDNASTRSPGRSGRSGAGAFYREEKSGEEESRRPIIRAHRSRQRRAEDGAPSSSTVGWRWTEKAAEGFLHCVARRAKKRRVRESRAAPVGMTITNEAGISWEGARGSRWCGFGWRVGAGGSNGRDRRGEWRRLYRGQRGRIPWGCCQRGRRRRRGSRRVR